MYGHGHQYNIFTDLIIPHGPHLGDGDIDLIGTTHGDPLYIMTIIHTGDHTTTTTLLVIPIELFLLIGFTDLTGQHR
jgi:hypothetical protein